MEKLEIILIQENVEALCEKVFILMNIWMIGKNSMKHRYLNCYVVTDADYAHAKRVCKVFEIKDVEEYRDFYNQGNTFLLADIFETVRNMCLKIYELDPAEFLSALE